MIVPQSFADHVAAAAGAPGRAWLATLPALAGAYCRRWSLTLDGPAMHGYVGLVLPVSRVDGTRAVLKLSWRDEETRDEPVALAAWRGEGAVRLLANAPEDGVLLLERLDPERTLAGVPVAPATAVAAGLLRRLAVPAPPLSRALRAQAAEWVEELPELWEELDRPLPRPMLDAAVEVCRTRGPAAGDLLVNEDLHYDNVLARGKDPATWVVIDPKPIAGDVEFGVIPLLWNRLAESTLDERFGWVVAGAELDPALAREWTLVRAVINWLWCLDEDDEDDEDDEGEDGADEPDDPDGPDGEEDWLLAAVRRIAGWAYSGGAG
ncbi:streptomycin 6-kinase [Amycolatopsis arida]|uniref:Streptomycin 6-kinase n=1 Tax=Amycolatopsis arida TaxID=587909 RepID=A0A1I5WH40_9PSEU|nr:aminoglycoside phosphotransferase family protein [Amycolatopsis arida]TDX92276.1 streptomycin 6-kinase [Amycolatopsis arida]SFQ18949.1 streptomycin 6-kinase [Amycolatopsis arida]